MSTTAAELSSMAATVDDLVHRLGPIGDVYRGASRDDLVSELLEVERALNGALRRLNRIVATAGA